MRTNLAGDEGWNRDGFALGGETGGGRVDEVAVLERVDAAHGSATMPSAV